MMMEPDDLQLKYKPSKVCGICGDKALGYNFNAVTCEACKAFFRRNALRTKHSQQDFKCPFDGNCKIDLVTRRFCQKCRLKKCFDIGMKKEWILSDDEKKVKRDKIIENRRKKETGAPYGNLDTYSNSSVDEMTYSPEMKPSMKSMNSDLLNSNYSLSVSEGKGFFNSLYLLEQYQNQYQNFMSGKSPKESPTMAGPYSSGPIPKVPNHHSAGDVSPHGPSHNSSKSVDAVLRSPPPMAATSNSNPLLNGYQGIYPKGLEPGKHYGDYGYGPFSQHQQPPHHPHQHHSQHHPPQHRVPAMPGSSSTHNHRPPHPPLPPPPSNGHLNGGGGGGGHHLMPTMPPAALEKPDTPIHALPSPFYQKCADSAELNRGHMSEISSNSSDSSYHFNPYYQEKNLAARSRSESQITSPEQQQLPNGKSPQVRLNGSTDSGFTKENDSNEYLSSDEENLSARGGGGGAPYAKDLNEDSNSVSNCDLRRPILATPAALPSSSGKNVHMEKLMGDSGSNSTGSSAANANTSRNSSSGTGEHTTSSSSSSSSSGSNCNISSSIRTGSGGASVVKPSLSVYNFIEELRMQELSSACDLLRPWTRYRKVVHEMSQVNQMYEAVEQIINKVIEMSRMVTTFKDLCEMEQMALLKGAVTEMIILRSVLNYMPDKDSWVFNLLSETDEGQFLKYSTYEKLICKGYYVEVKQFMLSFSQDWKNDKTLFDLLTVIILFTPNRPNLKHKEIIKLEYLTWRHLLQKHLHAKVGSKELSQTYFSNLMDLLERLHAINEKVNKMYTFKVIESFKL